MDSWRGLPAAQQPPWPDEGALREAVAWLSVAPPLVTAEETDRLTSLLGRAARGEAFVLQGGDCAERFDHVTPERVAGRLGTLARMAEVLEAAAGVPVVRVGRIAGQFAKPRSAPAETRDGVSLPSYRGDIVNGAEFTGAARTPDPWRMVRAHRASAATLELVRASGVPVHTSHEALLLEYEGALTRRRAGGWYDTSAHLLWIGERTRDPGGAHVEFAARIANPVAVKLGPAATAREVLELADRLNPWRVPGRLSFIARMGADRVREALPPLVRAVAASGVPVVWLCDPMHGNTETAPSGHKTRPVARVLAEVAGFFEVHRAAGTRPGGLHLEMTGDDVTECVGGAVSERDLPLRYESACDPRLNREQSLEVAAYGAGLLRG
ncbi:3-deoxy-7-phosphoheptulonate synthase [Saccharothrix syringae]|uniref:Phospho-2-dehydro-3-deoxyheptonate aldolase n=1 Tax=Saccharothrix syringae TaxID=103733 RepID=A0A5Q0HCV9_SACSY|nr:3-deoxy-7-phosphoheptulonate synthase [Saccharothrix syringae]